jgi:glutamine---fructose-6-phosphate transaminase (isomerizing)
MNPMLQEIMEIPARAKEFLDRSPSYTLPRNAKYLGMGSSYFAPLSFKYMGIDIYPELASEYYNYLHTGDKLSSGVLLSQSGRSSEVLWCTSLFEKYTAITNTADSSLSKSPNAEQVIHILAGEEKYSSSKTYTNTLLALAKGFGIDMHHAVGLLTEKMSEYDRQGKALAETIFGLLEAQKITGLYITGSGPNIGTALEAALILSESTKLNFHGLPMAQYDHGPKETAANSIVIQILAKGKSYERSKKLSDAIRGQGAYIFTVEETDVTENESVLTNILPFNFMAYYLSLKLNVGETFVVGGKVTEVL